MVQSTNGETNFLHIDNRVWQGDGAKYIYNMHRLRTLYGCTMLTLTKRSQEKARWE